jgi:hypothetical protein
VKLAGNSTPRTSRCTSSKANRWGIQFFHIHLCCNFSVPQPVSSQLSVWLKFAAPGAIRMWMSEVSSPKHHSNFNLKTHVSLIAIIYCVSLIEIVVQKKNVKPSHHSSDTIAFQFSCCQSWELPQASVTSSKKVCLGSAESWCFCWDPADKSMTCTPLPSMSFYVNVLNPLHLNLLGELHLGTEQGLQRSTAGACTQGCAASPIICGGKVTTWDSPNAINHPQNHHFHGYK